MAGSEHAWMGFIPIPVPGEDSHDTYCGDSESLETAWLLSFLLSMVFSLFLILKLSHNLAINCFFVFKNESESHSVMSDSLPPHGLCSPWNSPGQNTGVGSLFLLQGIFLTKGSKPGLPLCRQILYQLSHKGSTRILEWAAYPLTQELYRSLPHCSWILYQLSYQGSRFFFSS